MKGHRLGSLAGVLAAACAASVVVASQGAPAVVPPSSLYARLGGYDFIARFVDTAFPRVGSHPQLRRLFQGHSQESQLRQRQLIVDALCLASGGPCVYTGRGMRPVHTGLGITHQTGRYSSASLAAPWKS